MDAVLHAASNTAEDFPGGVTGMAIAIGKNKFSLMHELAGTGTAKLGLLDAMKMVKRSKDWRVLNAIGTECGGIFVPLPQLQQCDGSTFTDLSALAKEFADLVQEVTRDAADGRISDNEMQRLEREWGEMVAAGQLLMSHLRGKHEAALPGNRPTPRAA